MLILLKKSALLSELQQITDYLYKRNIEYLTSRSNERIIIEILHPEDEDKITDRDLLKNFPIDFVFREKTPVFSPWIFSRRSLEFIAGPCAVENEEMLDKTASFLSNLGIKYLRGGAFKFRTSFSSFQGLGKEGYKILSKTAKKYNMFSVSEVFDTRHLKYVEDIDVLQIGARAMYNTELLKELGHSNKPIIVKRAYSATIDDYMQMVNYIVKSGNDKIILCERGTDSKYSKSRYSFDPLSVYKLKEFGLPVCVDISHPAGDRKIVPFFSRMAVTAEADIIMVEIHPDPINSLSDSAQALSFQSFKSLYENSIKLKNLIETMDIYG